MTCVAGCMDVVSLDFSDISFLHDESVTVYTTNNNKDHYQHVGSHCDCVQIPPPPPKKKKKKKRKSIHHWIVSAVKVGEVYIYATTCNHLVHDRHRQR